MRVCCRPLLIWLCAIFSLFQFVNGRSQPSMRRAISKLLDRGNPKLSFISTFNTFRKSRPFRIKQSITCRIFGFENSNVEFFQGIFGQNMTNQFSVQYGNLRMQVIKSSKPSDIYNFQGDACIGYVQSGEVLSQDHMLIANIHSYVETALAANRTARLVLMVTRSAASENTNEEKALQSLVKVIAQASMNARPYHHRDTAVPPIELHIIRASLDKDKTGRVTRSVLQRILTDISVKQLHPNLELPTFLIPYANVARKSAAWVRFKLFPVQRAVETVSMTIRPDPLSSRAPHTRFTHQDVSHLDRIEQTSFFLLKNLSSLIMGYREDEAKTSAPFVDFSDLSEEVSRIKASLETSIRHSLLTFENILIDDIRDGNSNRTTRMHPSFGFVGNPTVASKKLNLRLPSVPLALHNGLRVMLSSLFGHLLQKYERSKLHMLKETLTIFKNITANNFDGIGIDGKQITALQKEIVLSIEKDLLALKTAFMEMLLSPPGIDTQSEFFSAYRTIQCEFPSTSSIFSTHLTMMRLRSAVNNAFEDCRHEMYLAGTYNPYIRTSPFPPVSIGVHCLGNPIDTIAKLSFSAFSEYDRPNSGLCDNRADPICDTVLDAVKHKLMWGMGPKRYPKLSRSPWWMRAVTGEKYSRGKKS